MPICARRFLLYQEFGRMLKGTVMQISKYSKYMFASTQITNTEIFAFIAVLVFKLVSRKVVFINNKDNRNC